MKTKRSKIAFIYWFAYYNLDSPSVRYRAKYPLNFLREQRNIQSYFVFPTYSIKGILLFLKAYFSALLFRKRNSIIVIQRVQSNFIYANLLKFLVRARCHDTVYDLDDADYLEINPKTIYYFSQHCEMVSAGSQQIKNHLTRLNPKIVHTSSPIYDLHIVKNHKNACFTVGWIGGFGGEHKEGLIELVFPALKELSFHLKLIIVGILKTDDLVYVERYFQDNSNIEIEMPVGIDWNDEVDIQKRIALFDVGIATLTNSEKQISKSGIKAKQYLNNGVPVLSTNLPENNVVVVDGENGYFCNTSSDFKKRLTQFYQMSEVDYLTFSKKARDSIRNFDHHKYFSDFVEARNDSYN